MEGGPEDKDPRVEPVRPKVVGRGGKLLLVEELVDVAQDQIGGNKGK